ncbi:hypothetical protein E5361_08315 [Histophilus somni]|uniref:hypothetical protein n=1 Tax=Histophilus somni TaxID=731 RepID=UPI00109CA5C4|nr:hypothetical protein [Histophilus somni]THA20973.1 hypothetical protein E5361_08315 [Histophilus somni]
MTKFKLSAVALSAILSCVSLSSQANLSLKDINAANQVSEMIIPAMTEFLGKPVKLKGISVDEAEAIPLNEIDVPNAVCTDYLLASNYMDLYEMSFSLHFGRESYKDFKNPFANAIKAISFGASDQYSKCLMKEKGLSDEMEAINYMLENMEKITESDKRFAKLSDFDVAFSVEETVNKIAEMLNK